MKRDIKGMRMMELAPSAPLEHTVTEKTHILVFHANMAIPHIKLEPPADQIALKVRLP